MFEAIQLISNIPSMQWEIKYPTQGEMCNLSWTPHSNLEKDNSLNHSCDSVSPKMDCLE